MQVERLQSQLCHLQDSVKDRDVQIEQLNEDLIALNKEYNNLKSIKTVYDNKTSNFNEELDFKNNRIGVLEKRNKELHAKLEDAEINADELLDNINKLSAEYKMLLAENEQYQNELQNRLKKNEE